MICSGISTYAASLLIALTSVQDDGDPLERSVIAEYMRVRGEVANGSVDAHWIDTDRREIGGGFWFVRDSGSGPRILVMTADQAEPRELFDVARVRSAYAAASGREVRGDGLPFHDFEFLDGKDAVRFHADGRDWRLSLDDWAVEGLSKVDHEKPAAARVLRPPFTYGDEPLEESTAPDGETFLGDDERNLYLRRGHSDEKTWLTDDGEEDDAWSMHDAKWSSDGRIIAASRVDTRHTPRVPVVDWLQKNAKVEHHPFCKSGQRMGTTETFLFHTESGRRVRVAGTGRRDHREFAVGFAPGDREFWLLRADRLLSAVELIAVDVETGESRSVLREESDTFVGGLDFYLLFQDLCHFHGPSGAFLWLSERDGFRHVYLYAPSGRLIRQLTHGDYPVRKVEYSDANYVWFHATIDHPYQSQLCRAPLRGGAIERVTAGAGEHTVQFSPDHKLVLDTWSSPTIPPRTELRRANGELIGQVASAEEAEVSAGGLQPPEEFTALAADGETTLYGQIYRPRDFDPNRQYPVIDAIYGGPFVQWLPRSFGDYRSIENHLLTNLGFIVFAVDSRGTVGRGKDFQDAIFRDWGGVTLDDHAAVIRQLGERHPWFDTGRVGIFGGSWGGYFTIRALVAHPEVFHVGVATNPVVDLDDHAALPIEPYVGLPSKNREVYEAASCPRLAHQLKGRLLLVHGTSDVNATMSATMKMVAALIEANKEFDMVIIPNANHGLQGDVSGAMQWVQRKTRRYFVEHLEPATRGR